MCRSVKSHACSSGSTADARPGDVKCGHEQALDHGPLQQRATRRDGLLLLLQQGSVCVPRVAAALASALRDERPLALTGAPVPHWTTRERP
jgi:hypothetical protein